jgi:hypothetical protein
MANTFVKIASVSLTGSGGFEFNSIPSTYTDLCLKISSRATEASNTSALLMGFNGDTGANFNNRNIYGNGSTAASNSISNQNFYVIGPFTSGSTSTSNTFGNAEIYIPNYAGSNQKSFSMDSVTENNGTAAEAYLQAGLWTGTAAINKIQIYRTCAQYTTATLYGIKNS